MCLPSSSIFKAIHVGSPARMRHDVCSDPVQCLLQPMTVHARLESGHGIKIKYRFGSDNFSATSPRGKRLGSTKLSVLELLFADDAAFLADSKEEMQHIVNVVDAVVTAFGQEISKRKTEIMVVHPKGNDDYDRVVKVGAYTLIWLRNFKMIEQSWMLRFRLDARRCRRHFGSFRSTRT